MKKKKKILILTIFSVFLIFFSLTIYQINQSQSSRKIQPKVENWSQRSQRQTNNTVENSLPSKKKGGHKKTEKDKPENNQKPSDVPQLKEDSVNQPIEEEKKPSPPKIETTPKEKEPSKEPTKPNEEPKIPTPPVHPPNRDKPLEIKNGKVQVPRRWLWTTEMNNIVSLFIPSEKWDEEITQHRAYINPAGGFVFGSGLWDVKKDGKRDLNFYKTLKLNQLLDEDPEIVFIPVNVNSFHHSLLVYKKSDDLFRHYDSLGGSNFSTIQTGTINGKLKQENCPQQSGDGWGSCGTYPPVITNILLKRYQKNGLANPSDWEISKEEFLTERDRVMDLI
jgi:hypothetical protein